MVKNLPTIQETSVLSLGREDPLKEEMATHSSIPAWRISWAEEPTKLQSTDHKESNTTESHTYIHDQVNYGVFRFKTYSSL